MTPEMRAAQKAARVPTGPISTDEAIRLMDRYGSCIVETRTKTASLITGPLRNEAALQRAMNTSEVQYCLGNNKVGFDVEMRFEPESLRSAVFKAMYRQKYVSAPPGFKTAPIDWAPVVAGADAAIAKRFMILHRIAECTLAAAPGTVHQLIISDYGADTHKAAFASLTPVIGDCLPDGMQLQLPRPSLAGALAEVAWRQAAPPQ